MSASVSDFILATLAPWQLRELQKALAARGSVAYDEAVTRAARESYDSPALGFIDAELSDETVKNLFCALRAIVARSIATPMVRDDFVSLLTNLGVGAVTAQNLVDRNMTFEDVDFSNVIRSLTSVLPSVSGGLVTEFSASIAEIFDRFTPDSVQQDVNNALLLWDQFGAIMRKLPDRARLREVIIHRKTPDADPSSSNMSDAWEVMKSVAQALLIGAAGAGAAVLTRGRIPGLLGRVRTLGPGASRAIGSGAAAALPGGSAPMLPPATGDLYEEADAFHDAEDDDDLVVLSELGDLLVHPHVFITPDLYGADVRREAGDLAARVVDYMRAIAAGEAETGDFFSDIGNFASNFISDAVGVAGQAISTVLPPLAPVILPLSQVAGQALEGLAKQELAKAKVRKPVPMHRPVRAPQSKQASRPIVKKFGQAKADAIDVMRLPAVVARSSAGSNTTGKLLELFARKGSKTTFLDVQKALT